MNERKIWDALGEIDAGLIEEAGERLAEREAFRAARERRRGRRRIALRVGGMAAMAGLVIFLGAMHQSEPEKESTQHVEKKLLIQEASKPEKPKGRKVAGGGETPQPPEEKKVEAYDENASHSSDQPPEKGMGMGKFYEASIGRTLLNHSGENVVYSPANLYLALGMLAEMGNGNTRQDILSVMGEEHLENARKDCMELQSQLCWQENTFRSVLSHSVWLGEGIDYGRDMVSTLGRSHCASVFQGAGGTSRNGFDMLSVCAFEGRWGEGIEFERRGAGEGTFYQRSGSERKVSFMRGVVREEDVTVAKRYRSVDLGLSGGSRLTVYLPREGVNVEEMLRKDLRGFLSGSRDGEGENGGRDPVQVSLPKFQVSSDIALDDVVKGMGLDNIFEEEMADFSQLLAEEEEGKADQEGSPYVGKIKQNAELVLDESGCGTKSHQEAGNAERRGEGNGDGQQDEDAFICNRPFAFIVWSQEEVPVLAGMIHTLE